MNAYDILGISPTNDMSIIKNAYKKMIQATHPDKMGHAKYFMMVHDAYEELAGLYNIKEKNMPSIPMQYNPNDIGIKQVKPCENKDFNEFFEKNKIYEIDPYKKGYTVDCSSSNKRDSIDQIKRQNIKQFQRNIIKYNEPQPLSLSRKLMDKCRLLGIEKIEDFGITNASDYSQAFCDPEIIHDKRVYYKNIDEVYKARRDCDFTMNEQEKALHKKKKKGRRM